MNKQFTLPFYAKVSLILIGMFFFISMLYIAQDIILPLIYAAVIAILISPAINLLVRIKINRTLAISIVLFIAVLFIVGLIVLIISRTNLLIEALPQMTAKFETLLRDAVKWASEYLHITTKEIDIWLANEKAQLMESNNIGVSGTLVSMGSGLTIMMLTPVYTFMLLYYQPHLVLFVHQLFGNDNDKSVTEILSETKVIIQNYWFVIKCHSLYRRNSRSGIVYGGSFSYQSAYLCVLCIHALYRHTVYRQQLYRSKNCWFQSETQRARVYYRSDCGCSSMGHIRHVSFHTHTRHHQADFRPH
jgi:hypothetical protein